MKPRSVQESRVVMTELVMPNDTNPLGNAMGGRVLHLMDVAAAISAGRHARRPCVTAAIDDVQFRAPVPMGSVLVLEASVNLACHTSMEVGVRVESEDRRTGERRHCATAYLTFVAIDEEGKPAPVPPLEPRTEEERERMEAARKRRERRLARRAGR